MLLADSIARSQIPKRRIRYALLTGAICCVLVFCATELEQNLWHSNYFTGYLLLACTLFLSAFNLRKKVTFLPSVGSAAAWMQAHIWVGLSTFVLFGLHIAWRVPSGLFESLLAFLYLLVAGSGVYGLFITRLLPKRLTNVGQEFVFERIPVLRTQVAYEAKQTAMGSLAASDVIGRFYLQRLLPYFEKPRRVGYLLFPSSRLKRQLIHELQELQRYLSSDQRRIGQKLSEFVQRKDDLDYHHAMQGRLKLWLFVHIGFTYSLLAISILHVILVHAFIGSGL